MIQTRGDCEVELEIGDCHLPCEVTIGNICQEEVILGMDILSQFMCHLDGTKICMGPHWRYQSLFTPKRSFYNLPGLKASYRNFSLIRGGPLKQEANVTTQGPRTCVQ